MKLIFCLNCTDVVRLTTDKKECRCGKSGGYYLADGLNAAIWGSALPLGFANGSFVDAIRNQPKEGMGERFEAFVIPKECPTIVYHEKKPSEIKTVTRKSRGKAS